jgi:uncharacterized damage-inducible protein DinB
MPPVGYNETINVEQMVYHKESIVAEETVTLADVYAGWDDFNKKLVEALAPLSDEQLDLRVAPSQRSAREIILHLVRVRASWFELLGATDPEWKPYLTWDRPGQPTRNATEIVKGAEDTLRLLNEMLAGWTVADLAEKYEGDWRGEPYSLTRQWVIHHVLEHDHFHGGELFLTLGAHGISTPDL